MHFDAVLILVSLNIHITELTGSLQFLDGYALIFKSSIGHMVRFKTHCPDPRADCPQVSHILDIWRAHNHQDKHDVTDPR